MSASVSPTRHRAARIRVRIAGAALAGLITLACGAGTALAAPPGSETVERAGTLQTSSQSMWQQGSGAGPEEASINIFNDSWNASGKGGSITDVHSPTLKVCNITKGKTVEKFFTEGSTECEDEEEFNINIGEFGAEGSASTSGQVGMALKLHGFATGSVGVSYPVTAHYTIPKPYSFAAGEAITISTAETVDHGAALETAFPTLKSAALEGTFGFHAAASFNLCFFTCTGEKSLFDLSLPSGYNGTNPYTGTILEVANPGTVCFDTIVKFVAGFGNAPEAYDRCHNANTDTNSGYIALPDVKTTSTLHEDGSLTAAGEDPYVVVPISAITWASRLIPGDKPPALNFGPSEIPGTKITLGWKTIQLILTDIETMRQVFTFTPQVQTTLDWGQEMSYEVSGPKGEPVAQGSAEAASFPLGDTITLDTPSTLGKSLPVAPSLKMSKAELTNETENINIGEGEASALALTLDTPKAEVKLPDGKEFTAWPGTEINIGPVYKQPFPLSTSRNTIESSHWTLGGFNEPALGSLNLTPDPPPVPTALTVKPVEGQRFEGAVARFTDPEPSSSAADYTVAIKWGDGTEETGALTEIEEDAEGTVMEVLAHHTYREEGEYPIEVTIKDIDTPLLSATDISTAKVADAQLHATPHTNTTTSPEQPALLWPEGPSSGTLATFTDESPYGETADFTATIEWGDGSTTPGTISETEPGSHVWSVSGHHEYGPEDLGPHTATVTITDDGGSTASTSLTVIAYAFTAGGDFTIQPASPGSPVTFWGARFRAANPLLSAPAAFKGWADSAPTPPTCEGAWSTRPGNSSRPPAGIPTYMAVIETGEVGQAHDVIGGQAQGIAIVKTEGGYGPDPGHAGVGTLVAQACG